MARDLTLEAKLIEDPDDVSAYLVYADFLQSKGDPRGTLISLQHAGKTAEADALLDEHAEELLGPLRNYRVTFDGTEAPAFEWKRGFIRKATLSLDSNTVGDVELDDDEAEITLEAGLSALLTHPSGALLEELVVPINMLDDGGYFGPVVQALVTHGAPALRKLRLGMFQCCGGPGGDGDYEYEISWTSLGDASGLWKAAPRLKHLVIQSGLGGSSAEGTPDVLGTIAHPHLEHLEVITGGLGEGCLTSLANADLPALKDLEVWFGSDNYGARGGVDDLAPLFAGTRFPKLKRLALCNAELSNDLAAALVKAPIVKQLDALSLRYGTLDDAGGRALLNLPNLATLTLDVRDSFLSAEVVQLLKAACPKLLDSPQRSGDRYVSLSE